jgi:TolB-like protein
MDKPGKPAATILRFDEYEIDVEGGQLRKRGVRISLREKSFQVLASLIEHRGEVVKREELRRRLWPHEVFVDFDNNLNTAIARLRAALHDSAEHPRFIETVPKHGYRFMPSVSESAPARRSPGEAKPRIAVLPFVNLSGDPSQEYISDALTDEMITELAAVAPEHLTVIARTTAMRYKGSGKDVTRIGRELGLDFLVEGGMRRAEDRIVMTVQLIRVNDQAHLWARHYDAALSGIFTTSSAVAREIAHRLEIPASVGAVRAAIDERVYNLYLQARYQLYRDTPAGMAEAKKLFEEAIARAPGFALAHDGIAEIYWTLGFLGFAPPKEAFSTGIFHALRALEIDSTLAETHALLGMYRKELDYDWSEVRREMSCALEMNPASPTVRLRYAISGLLPHGRVLEAAGELDRILEADPLSWPVRSWLAIMLGLGRQYERGVEEARRVLELDPNHYMGHMIAGQVYRYMESYSEATAAFRRGSKLSGGAPYTLGWLGEALAKNGAAAEARAVLEQLHHMAAGSYVAPTSFAWIYLGLGETDEAFCWLEQAIDARDPMIVPIKTYPTLDPIRQDERFRGLLHKMNLDS